MSSAPVAGRDAGELLDQRPQALGDRDAPGVDPDERELRDVGMALDDLVGDAAKRALEVVLAQQHALGLGG